MLFHMNRKITIWIGVDGHWTIRDFLKSSVNRFDNVGITFRHPQQYNLVTMVATFCLQKRGLNFSSNWYNNPMSHQGKLIACIIDDLDQFYFKKSKIAEWRVNLNQNLKYEESNVVIPRYSNFTESLASRAFKNVVSPIFIKRSHC